MGGYATGIREEKPTRGSHWSVAEGQSEPKDTFLKREVGEAQKKLVSGMTLEQERSRTFVQVSEGGDDLKEISTASVFLVV